MRRDAPFEPSDGDFDKFIQELHKNSAHNSEINKKLAEQKLNGGFTSLETPQQSFNKIKQQHQKTMSDISNSVHERTYQMSQGSCAHDIFDNSASFSKNSSSNLYQGSQSYQGLSIQQNTLDSSNARVKASRGPANNQAPNNMSKNSTFQNSAKANNKTQKSIPPVFALFGFACLFIFILNDSPVEGFIFFLLMFFMQIATIALSKRNK